MMTLVNGDQVDHFDELAEQEFRNLTVSYKGNETYTAVLAIGVIILKLVKRNHNLFSDVSVTVSDDYYHKTQDHLAYIMETKKTISSLIMIPLH
jgi:hypothetical protein